MQGGAQDDTNELPFLVQSSQKKEEEERGWAGSRKFSAGLLRNLDNIDASHNSGINSS